MRAPNSSAWAVAARGVHMGGGVLVPINTRFVPTEAASLLNASGARIVFAAGEFLERHYLSRSPPKLSATQVRSARLWRWFAFQSRRI